MTVAKRDERTYIPAMQSRVFIEPMLPTAAKAPPEGADWVHEVKFDGWRAQLHIGTDGMRLFSRNGIDLTRRFERLRPAVARLPVKAAIMDCELVACDESAMPCFETLMRQRGKAPALCLFAFDVLMLDGERLMPLPLEDRKARLADVVAGSKSMHLQYPGVFEDATRLLAAGESMGLEGIVSKRRGSPYRPGRTTDWLKVKTASWRERHRERYRYFAG